MKGENEKCFPQSCYKSPKNLSFYLYLFVYLFYYFVYVIIYMSHKMMWLVKRLNRVRFS